MTLLSVRNQFLKKSGRYDLGTIDGLDNGANWYINSGQKMLDRRMANEFLLAKRLGVLEVGEYLKIFRQAKVIKNVWLTDPSDGSSFEPERKTYEQIRNFYGERLSVMTNGQPAYWAPAYVRLDPTLTIDEVTAQIDQMDEFVIDASTSSNGIIFAPPTDTEYQIDILGKFYTETLVDDADVSVWTESYEHVSVYAALYQLEVTHRNSTGAADWLNAIDNELIGIDMDGVEYDTDHISQMSG